MLIAVPNISEGRDPALIHRIRAPLAERVRVLDLHSDPVHSRSVLTLAGAADTMIDAIPALARACSDIDMARYDGVHPALGGLDVAPFVADQDAHAAIGAAHDCAAAIGAAGIPVYLYGLAARQAAARELPELRRGGLTQLIARARSGFLPDEGPASIDPHVGVVCVGARGTLIAFNVWLDAPSEVARAVADSVRAPGVIRALGLDMGGGKSQVSMNLIAPDRLGIDEAFERVASMARSHDARIASTEIVGLVPERFLPAPDAEAARLLLEPGRSLEAVLRA